MHKFSIVIFTVTGLVACSDEGGRQANVQQTQIRQVQVMRNQDTAQLRRGRKVFLQTCAQCHGKHAEGAPTWTQPDANGKYPPPPLNGSGHAWHHPKQALINTIKFGTGQLGGNMPAWNGRLSEQEIDDVIAWLQSQWPDELYAAWQRMDQASQQANK